MLKYLALVWDPARGGQADVASRLCAGSALTSGPPVFESPGLRVFCSDHSEHSAHPLKDDRGIIVGTIFPKPSVPTHEYEAITQIGRLTDNATASIVRSSGRSLITDYWGRFVGIVRDPSSSTVLVVKDAMGSLPCFITRTGGVTIVFSALSDCLDLGLTFSVNSEYLAARVALGPAYMASTGLSGISEVSGAECVRIRADHMDTQSYWDPYSIAASRPIEDFLKAVNELELVTKCCAHAWLSQHESILHQLSGGLDSSIVLGCMASAPTRPRIHCITYYLPGGNSDERPFARLAAEQANCSLTEHPRRASAVNFEDLLKLLPAVSPHPDCAFLEMGRSDRLAASEHNATAITTGDGGDSMFGAMGKEHAVSDLARRHGVGLPLFKLAAVVAPMLDQSVWQLLGTAIRAKATRKPWDVMETLLLDEPTLVSASVLSSIREHRKLPHRWFDIKRDTPRGTTMTALSLALPRPFYDPLIPPADFNPEPISPLLSQPVVELCLRIPSYIHATNGRDRSVARQAFKSDVPHEILQRQWKDRAAGCAEAILAQNIQMARELLLDGALVSDGLLDRDAVERALAVSRGKVSVYTLEIFDHLLTECWLRSCQSVSQSRRAAA